MRMTNPPPSTRFLPLFRASDDLEAEASLEADLREAHQAASLLAGEDPFLSTAALLCAADKALSEGQQPWALLDAADRQIGDLRLEHGCEEWPAQDWTREAQELAFLFGEERRLRALARALRDGRTAAPAMRRAG